MSGTLYGIGVGPGDPQLLTLRAVDVLRQVSAVLAPQARKSAESLALAIARPHLPAECEIMEAVFPMTEERAALELAWEQAAKMMLDRAAGGQSVAFLTLGDAMLYSTWSYLLTAIRRLQPDAPVATVPGITAMSACAAATGQPLAEGRAPLLIWPDAPPDDLSPLCRLAPNLVFMKADRHLHALADAAEAHRLAATAVRRCTLPDELICRDLRGMDESRNYFTTVLMHAEDAE